MLIGIISDSHGNEQALRQAIRTFARRGVKAIVHCGDVGTTRSLEVLGSAPAAVYLVAGNVDHSIHELETVAMQCNLHFAWEVALVQVDDRMILAATHGDDQQTLGSLIMSQRFPYVCHGHSHHQRDERIGATRVINPGALQRARVHTAVILDTDCDELEFLVVVDAPAPKNGRRAKAGIDSGRRTG